MDTIEAFQATIRGCLQRVHHEFSSFANTDRTTIVEREIDFSTRADRRISNVIVEYFREQPNAFAVRSEESGEAGIEEADWVIIADEIDGTANMMKGDDLPFGTVIAIARGFEPTFNDVVAMGFLALHTGDLYEAYEGGGAVLTRGWGTKGAFGGSPIELSTSGRASLSGDPFPELLLDQYMLSERPDIAEICWTRGYPADYRSSAHHMALVARGAYDLLITGDHCGLHSRKRSTAEELAGGYLLLHESGGAITSWKGDDIGPEAIGFANGRTFDAIAAASPTIAAEFAGLIDH